MAFTTAEVVLFADQSASLILQITGKSAYKRGRFDRRHGGRLKSALPIAERAQVDDVGISLAALEEIQAISENLTALVEIFGKNGELAENLEEARFANILRPTQRWLESIISMDWPGDTQWIREHICEMGLGGKIRGGGRES